MNVKTDYPGVSSEFNAFKHIAPDFNHAYHIFYTDYGTFKINQKYYVIVHYLPVKQIKPYFKEVEEQNDKE